MAEINLILEITYIVSVPMGLCLISKWRQPRRKWQAEVTAVVTKSMKGNNSRKVIFNQITLKRNGIPLQVIRAG